MKVMPRAPGPATGIIPCLSEVFNGFPVPMEHLRDNSSLDSFQVTRLGSLVPDHFMKFVGKITAVRLGLGDIYLVTSWSLTLWRMA
jgi:hypothetical protein